VVLFCGDVAKCKATESVLTPSRTASPVSRGALGRASPNFMGLASLGLDIGTFCDFLYSVLLLSVFLELDFLGLDLSRPQVSRLALDEGADAVLFVATEACVASYNLTQARARPRPYLRTTLVGINIVNR
jgi:hypothetical protein